MFTSTTLSFFLFAVALTQGQMDEDPECRPPHPPGSEGECCAFPDFLGGGADMHDVMKKCHDESGMKRPSGPPGSGSPPSAEEMAAHISAHEGLTQMKTANRQLMTKPLSLKDASKMPDCADECVLKSSNFIKSDGELDNDAIKATVTKMYTGDWAELASTTINKCLASAKSEVDASAKCKSGARQLIKCFTRTMFLNCPTSSWTESTECTAAKARLTKCPNAMAPMRRPKH